MGNLGKCVKTLGKALGFLGKWWEMCGNTVEFVGKGWEMVGNLGEHLGEIPTTRIEKDRTFFHFPFDPLDGDQCRNSSVSLNGVFPCEVGNNSFLRFRFPSISKHREVFGRPLDSVNFFCHFSKNFSVIAVGEI